MGTGLFLAKLKALSDDQLVPFGVDLAENMVEIARKRLPDLVAEVGDAALLDNYFPGQQFDCICTHFVTGYVSMRVLAPKIAARLKPGGYWSLVGGTKAAYPAMQAKGDSAILRWLVARALAKSTRQCSTRPINKRPSKPCSHSVSRFMPGDLSANDRVQ